MNSAAMPPSLYPDHQPTTATAAPAAMPLASSLSICSIRSASMVMSCVAEQMAMTRPAPITRASELTGSMVLQKRRHTRMTACNVRIQALRWPSLSVSTGTRNLSISGAHKKLKA